MSVYVSVYIVYRWLIYFYITRKYKHLLQIFQCFVVKDRCARQRNIAGKAVGSCGAEHIGAAKRYPRRFAGPPDRHHRCVLQGQDHRPRRRHDAGSGGRRGYVRRARIQGRVLLPGAERPDRFRRAPDGEVPRARHPGGGDGAHARGDKAQGQGHRGARAKRVRPACARRDDRGRPCEQGRREQAERQLAQARVPGALGAHQLEARLHGGVRRGRAARCGDCQDQRRSGRERARLFDDARSAKARGNAGRPRGAQPVRD